MPQQMMVALLSTGRMLLMSNDSPGSWACHNPCVDDRTKSQNKITEQNHTTDLKHAFFASVASARATETCSLTSTIMPLCVYVFLCAWNFAIKPAIPGVRVSQTATASLPWCRRGGSFSSPWITLSRVPFCSARVKCIAVS